MKKEDIPFDEDEYYPTYLDDIFVKFIHMGRGDGGRYIALFKKGKRKGWITGRLKDDYECICGDWFNNIIRKTTLQELYDSSPYNHKPIQNQAIVEIINRAEKSKLI